MHLSHMIRVCGTYAVHVHLFNGKELCCALWKDVWSHLSAMAYDVTSCDVTVWRRDIMWCHILMAHNKLLKIKRVIDRKRPTCRNNNRSHRQPFWMPLEINTLWYHSFWECTWLVFHSTFCCTWKTKYRYRTDGRTDGQTDGRYQTYNLPCFAVDN